MEELERLLKMYSRKLLGILLTIYCFIQIINAAETSGKCILMFANNFVTFAMI